MPTVRYQRRVSESTTPLPGGPSTPPAELFGGGSERVAAAGRGVLDMASKQVIEIAEAEGKAADDAVVQDAYGKIVTEKNRLTYDPKVGVKAQRGRDALGVVDKYKSDFSTYAADIEKNMTPRQRGMFNKLKQREELEFDGFLNRHVSEEVQTLEDESFKGLVSSLQDDTIQNFGVDGKVAGNMSMMRGAAMDRAARLGMDANQTQEFVSKIESKTYTGVIDRMLANGNDLDAKAFYEEHKDSIKGTDLAQTEKALEIGSLRGESQRQADVIIGKTDSMAAAIEETKSIENPAVREATENRVKDFYRLKKQAQDEADEERMKQATNIVEQSKDFDKVPPSMVAQMSVSERNSLRNYAENLREGKKPETEWGTYYELMGMASHKPTKEAFAKTNLMTYRDKMADAEFKQLVNLQSDIRNGKGKADEELDDYRTHAQIVNDTLLAAGVDPTPTKNASPGSDAWKAIQFRNAVTAQVREEQRVTGKKVSNERMQEISDNLMIRAVVDGTGFELPLVGRVGAKKKRIYELGPGEKVESVIVPKADREAIEAALRSRGRDVTDAEVERLYLKSRGN